MKQLSPCLSLSLAILALTALLLPKQMWSKLKSNWQWILLGGMLMIVVLLTYANLPGKDK
jgi:hypothetical protein